jgi:hypothetical protein
MNDTRPKISVYVDADNISPEWLESVFSFLEPRWNAYLRRAYGINLAARKDVFRSCGILAVEVFPNTKGKDAADHALIIDAMRELYRGHADAICIVSADGDFTRLAQAWREEGKDVLVYGPSQTPLALRSACTEFSVLGTRKSCAPAHAKTVGTGHGNGILNEDEMLNELMVAFTEITQAGNMVTVGRLSTVVRRRLPGFSPRNYKSRTMAKLLLRLKAFELDPRKDSKGSTCEYEVRSSGGLADLDPARPKPNETGLDVDCATTILRCA